ncbi:acyl-CoA synthetase [Cryptosporangium sp. NPDC051539]|uniref:acyl-CoA synthetase n=1 Tax=Cryptosporangium sp. NPDC051539 TaxID=3363962 RepID=UPI0037989B10
MVLTVADLVEHAVDLVPDRVALVFGSRRLTYAEYEGRANQLAHHLARQGVGPGDHVALYTSNTVEATEVMLAVCKLRAVVINVNFRSTENELRYVLRDSDAVALVYQRGLAGNVAAVRADCPDLRHVVEFEGAPPGIEAPGTVDGAADYEEALAAESPERDFAERDPHDLFIIYTGGTTGRPKGVMWHHEDIWRVLGGGVDFMTGVPIEDEWEQARSGVGGAVVRLVSAPLIHGAAQWTLYGALFTGGTIVLMPKFDAHDIWRAITDEGINVLAIVGDAMARPLLEAYREGPPDGGKYDPSSLLAISTTAALMSPGVKREYLDTFPNVFLTEAVGSSETGFSGIGAISKDNIEPRGPRVNSSRETIVIDEYNRKIEPGSGQVGRLARGGYLPQGYYKDPEKTAALFAVVDGKRYTVPGDFAIPEADGTFLLLGRGNTCINTGGEKVYPEEVEGALKSHPGVYDALVVGVPDERLGWKVGAIVQWRENAEPDVATLDAAGRIELAGYKMPRAYWWVDQMPRLATGKADYTGARRHTEDNPPSQELPVTAGH